MTSVPMKSLWAMALALLAVPCAASNRDHKVDLITISARFIEVHSRTSHKSGDADEQFIEDVITPSVHAAVDEVGSAMTDAQRDAAIAFLLVSENSASEEISEIAATLYETQKTKLCTSISKLTKLKRTIVLNRVKSGLAGTGKPAPPAICP